MLAQASPRVWVAKPGSQRRYLSCPHFEALYGGTRGPGKSDCLLMDYAQHVGQGFERHWRGIIFRQTYPQLSEIIEKSIRWFSQIFPEANYNKGAHTWEFADGEQLIFRHMDDPADYWNYHGHEYPFIGWEEVTTWPDDRCYVAMLSCCRSSRAGMPRKYRANANPWGVGHHWVKQRFVEPAPSGTVIYPCYGPNCGWAGTKAEVQIANGRWICPKCGTWGSLKRLRVMVSGHYSENTSLTEADPDYIINLQSQTDEAKRKAWLEGDWNIAAGSYFGDLWSSAHHVVEPFDIPESWLINRSFDWGSSAPFSVGWWAQSDGTEATMRDGSKRSWPRGTLFRIAEWYGWNGRSNEGLRMLAAEIARGILEHEQSMKLGGRVKAGPADSSIFEESNGKCIADEMARAGVAWVRSDKSPGSRAVGAELMRSLLSAGRESPVEKPGLFVFDTCRHFIRTVPVLPRDEKKPDDVDTDAEDHCFVGETLIETPVGTVRMDEAPRDGVVWTDAGWRRYHGLRLTRSNAETVTVHLDNGASERCTPDHLWLTAQGWREAGQLLGMEVLVSQWKSRGSALPARSSGGIDTTCAEGTSAATSKVRAGSICTELSGLPLMDRYRTDSTFTTGTTTGQTTASKTSRRSPARNILASATAKRLRSACWTVWRTVSMLVLSSFPRLGTVPARAGHGIRGTLGRLSPILSRRNASRAASAESSSSQRLTFTRISSDSAPTPASQLGDAARESTTSIASAHAAGPSSDPTDTPAPFIARARVVLVERADPADVWCMQVPVLERFCLASGPIVHNCWDETRYRILDNAQKPNWRGGRRAA